MGKLDNDTKAAVAAETVITRKQKGKKSIETVTVRSSGDNTRQYEYQRRVSTPGKDKYDNKQLFQSGDTLQTRKNGKTSIYIGPKAGKKFDRRSK